MTLTPERPRKGPPPAATTDHTWTDAESRTAFDLMGDRFIDVTRRWLRSTRRQRLQHDVYTVQGVELTLPQVDALESVAVGDMRMHELADLLRVDPSTATRTVTPLVRLGLVERDMDPANRRFVLLHCTPAGHEAASTVVKRRRQLMEDVMSAMDPRRRLLLADLLEEWLVLINAHEDREGNAGRKPGATS